MDGMKILNYLAGEYREKIQSYQRTINKGNVDDFAEYKRLVGVVWGIESSLALVMDTIKRLENGEGDHE